MAMKIMNNEQPRVLFRLVQEIRGIVLAIFSFDQSIVHIHVSIWIGLFVDWLGQQYLLTITIRFKEC